MRNLLAVTCTLLLLSAGAVAGPVLLITNPDISAPPGGSAAWNFELWNDSPDWLVVGSAFFWDVSPVGVYSDLISPVDHPVAPGETWDGPFIRYDVDPLAEIGAVSSGGFWILYDAFDNAPPDGTQLVFGAELWATTDVEVEPGVFELQAGSITVSAVPEPGAGVLLAAGLLLLGLGKRAFARG